MPDEKVIFDARAKEAQLRQEAESWNPTAVAAKEAPLLDIPLLDVSSFLSAGNTDSGHVDKDLAAQLGHACETVGFFALTGHGIPQDLQDRLVQALRVYFEQPEAIKREQLMDSDALAIKGVGYLPLYNRKLPARSNPNANEAFLVKRSHEIAWNDNPWPLHPSQEEFKSVVEEYGNAMESLARSLLPLFAVALNMEPSYFDEAFENPFYRLRLTHYPPQQPPQPSSSSQDGSTTSPLGIHPHVDTSFFTLLKQTHPGLTIRDERSGEWKRVPLLEDALIVNVGELLRQWTNDRFISVKHFAKNINTDSTNNHSSNDSNSRYSVPFFWNANADHVMTCVPSCCSPDNPSKYPPVSYRGSQATAQGE